MKKVILAAVAAMAFVQPALAKEEAVLQNWSFNQGRGYCEMATLYGEKDAIRLSIMFSAAGGLLVEATSASWKVEKDKTYAILYSVKKNVAGETQIKGRVDGDQQGFANGADLSFIDDMMKNGFFKFRIGAAGISGSLDTSASGPAYAEFKMCAAELKNRRNVAVADLKRDN